jgi:hypothetical protein
VIFPRTAAAQSSLYPEVVQAVLAFLTRTVRAVRIAATDKRIPKPLRWMAMLGLLPVPGPFDEALLILVAVPLALFFRRPLAEAWAQAEQR